MADETFNDVWFLPAENTWKDFDVRAYKDKGTLVIHDASLEFRGSSRTVMINDLQNVSYVRQGRDFINHWVRIEFGNETPRGVAFFADGTLLGWGGIFGGTRRLFRSVSSLIGQEAH